MILLAFETIASCPQPSYCNRACWNTNGAYPAQTNPTLTTPTHIIVHHTGDGVVFPNSTNWQSKVRYYWDLHVNTNGWADIGYNWLIDRNGTIYEGRGNGIQGAHFSGQNSGTMGVALIGDFTMETPSTNALTSLKNLIAWEAKDKNIDITTSSYHSSSQLNLNNISGHSDGGSTSCPGTNLYTLLPSIRTGVANFSCYNGSGNNNSSSSSAPNNDECNNAIQLTSGTNCNYTSGTVDGATPDNSWTNASCYVTNPSHTPLMADVFYKFTAVCSSHIIKVNPTGTVANSLDAVLAIYGGANCYSLQEIGCSDNGGGAGMAEIATVTGLTVGNVYYIRIYDWGSQMPTDGNFNVCVTHSCSPVSPPSTPTISGNTQICSGQSTTLSVSNICSGCSYQWSNGQTGTSISVNNSGSYSVTATNSAGSTTSASVYVSQSNGPSINVYPQNPSICANASQPIQLTASGANSYTWSNGMQSSSINVYTAGTYTVTGTDNNGCTNTATVQVQQNNGPNVSLVANPPSINSGQSSTLTVTPSNAINYQWTPPNLNGSTVTVNPTNTTNYSVTVTDNNGCTGSANTAVNVIPTNCNTSTLSLSSTQQNFDNTSQGSNFSVNFNPSASSCTWSVSSNCNWVTLTTPISPQTQSGVVNFQIMENTGVQRTCSLIVSTGNNVYYYAVTQDGQNGGGGTGGNPCSLPKPTINSTGQPTLAASTHQNVVYQWLFNGSPILGVTGQYHTATTDGCYTVKIFDSNDNTCFKESDPICINSVSINEYVNMESFELYPNPNNGVFNLSFELLEAEYLNVAIINSLGKKVYSKSYDEVLFGQKNILMNLENLSNGIYFVRINIGGNFITRKILIKK